MRGKNLRFGALLLALGLLIGAVCGGTAVAVQTHMMNARDDLNAARNQLNAAEPDKAGHRASALNLVNQAITQVNAGIAAAQ